MVYPHLRSGVWRGHIRVTGNGIVRAPLIKYNRKGKLQEVVNIRHSNGIHRIPVLHPAYRGHSVVANGSGVVDIGYSNPEVKIAPGELNGSGSRSNVNRNRIRKALGNMMR